MSALQQALLMGGGSSYVANAVLFDGTNDYAQSVGQPIGLVDGYQGLLSVWLRIDGADGTIQRIIGDANQYVVIRRHNTNKFFFEFNGQSSGYFSFTTGSTYTNSMTWLHLLASWDTNFSAGNKKAHLYVNNVSDIAGVFDTDPAFQINYEDSGTDYAIAALPGGFQRANLGMSEFYFASTYLDLTNSANRAKFILSGKPVDLGSTGSLPTGSQPLLYFNNPAASFGTNKGSGGNFSVTGTLDNITPP